MRVTIESLRLCKNQEVSPTDFNKTTWTKKKKMSSGSTPQGETHKFRNKCL